MAKWIKPNQTKAHRKFTATAAKVNPKNLVLKPTRGGYRL